MYGMQCTKKVYAKHLPPFIDVYLFQRSDNGLSGDIMRMSILPVLLSADSIISFTASKSDTSAGNWIA